MDGVMNDQSEFLGGASATVNGTAVEIGAAEPPVTLVEAGDKAAEVQAALATPIQIGGGDVMSRLVQMSQMLNDATLIMWAMLSMQGGQVRIPGERFAPPIGNIVWAKDGTDLIVTAVAAVPAAHGAPAAGEPVIEGAEQAPTIAV